MTAPANLLDSRFGRLLVISRASNTRAHKAQWLCQCDCGAFTIVPTGTLRTGHTQSCGCLHRELLSERQARHRMSESPEFRIYAGLITRCTNSNRQQWKDYGGRGIRCLFVSFEEFYAEVGPRPSPRHTIERISNDGDYAKGNIRWATRKEQNRNRRDNILVTHDGKTQCIGAWAEELGIHPQTLYSRHTRHKPLF